jgi:cell division protein FtsL
MERIEEFTQTYSQAPWRMQLQIIGLFSLVLVIIALIASIYLNVSARAATVGRDIQDMQDQIVAEDREIEDLQSQLASILAAPNMESRAINLGFEFVDPEEVVYLAVPGYMERQPAVLAPYSERTVVSAPITPPEHTEPLFDWLKRQFVIISNKIVEAQP